MGGGGGRERDREREREEKKKERREKYERKEERREAAFSQDLVPAPSETSIFYKSPLFCFDWSWWVTAASPLRPSSRHRVLLFLPDLSLPPPPSAWMHRAVCRRTQECPGKAH